MKSVKVAAAIICDGDKVFATQRAGGEFKGGWEFPGGKIEPGETPEQAVVREIKEEIEMEIEVDSFFDKVVYDYPSFHLEMDCFICRFKGGQMHLNEHSQGRWLTAVTLDSVDWLPADRGLIEKLKIYLEKEV